MIESLSETDLKVVGRVLEGLLARPEKQLSPAQFARMHSPVRPPHVPLAKQFGALLQQPDRPTDYEQLLKRNLYTRLSDLMAWINHSNLTNHTPQK
ncbi:hypothetical protein COW36_17010 [bacterium (Candidatus Blackallbacteria) CG17_big_fil_post_rev_8_21_14_2_50_48_46]|uniref:Uncharacterized protein n=1 Tax=bacterium (Candidatus Blackallbacteria) CG17_big_fil_post_rev_8_21_14_2_50_48_46 TaxID=2014261 RepID=A0A2M7G1A9_9BACT|nr:MAG: hypothetical protein COW64_09320 [bacterium (Candidatus Blackallbacteria) CG18_big_fil_WC_8_21_14_2_50_49_26]PIW15502.1 MAG: hypothetical protein COW36_17010 [bacterium (Candidatus Blackallbacteria) CG17_big_fil_post_rev_8_21_14_2_50_48_46]PIW48598.1 MAG: hypothetical protein COW20_08835 [bacterium (Candidatus Blackallbacteria) CG13_big_fil_rev_8_21_14_2_50_49_14]